MKQANENDRTTWNYKKQYEKLTIYCINRLKYGFDQAAKWTKIRSK